MKKKIKSGLLSEDRLPLWADLDANNQAWVTENYPYNPALSLYGWY